MRKSGQVTVFLSLVLLCVFSLLLGLLESARTAGARCYLKMAADSSMDSLFSGYHREAWDTYRLFLLEYETEEKLEDTWMHYMEPYEETHGWYPFKTQSADVQEVSGITEDHGAYLKAEILDYMRFGIWNLETDELHVDNLLKSIKEAGSAGTIASAYNGHTKEAVRLERALEAIVSSLEKQEMDCRLAAERLDRYDGSGFRSAAGKLRQEVKQIPGLVKTYEKRAEELAKRLEETKRNVAVQRAELSDEVWNAVEEELAGYEAYVSQDGERRLEIEALWEKEEANLTIWEDAVERSYEVEEEIDAWEDSEEDGDGPDEGALWSLVSGIWEQSRIPRLSFQCGVKDPQKQDFLEQIERMVDMDLLGLVLPEGMEVSRGVMDMADFPSLVYMDEKGDGDTGLIDRLLVNEYCVQFLANFFSEEEKEVKYEQEYLIGGKSSDIENLKKTVTDILLVREGMNFIHILTNPEKRAEARALAQVITGVTGLAPLAGVVTFFVMGVWALGEAVVDVKALMAGNRVALIKTTDTWKLNLEQLLSMGEAGACSSSGDDDGGLDYTGYIKLLLLTGFSERLYYRLMDVIQMNLQRKQGDFRMEYCAYFVRLQAEVKGRHLFFDSGDAGYTMKVSTEKAY